jgi:hypothetical protein
MPGRERIVGGERHEHGPSVRLEGTLAPEGALQHVVIEKVGEEARLQGFPPGVSHVFVVEDQSQA